MAGHASSFRWVYDCGTSNSSKLLATAMANLESEVSPGRKIELVAISHFDKDHVNGLLGLLKTFRVGILLLPYLTPWQRMRIAIAEDAGPGNPLFDFLIAPTATALAIADAADTGIERILLVPPGDGPVASVEIPGDPLDREPSLDDGPFPEPDFRDREPPTEPDDTDDSPEDAAPGSDSGLHDPRVSVLAPQSSITVGHYWEFLPYNDAGFAPSDPASFRTGAAPLVRRLRKTKDPAVAKTCLDALKALYKRTFGDGSKPRNAISLFLYSGPLGRPLLDRATERCESNDRAPWCYGPGPVEIFPDRFGQFLTGDGYLNDQPRLDAFLRYYGAARIARGGCFQVMHHGSKHNWFEGVAKAVDPAVSLFSSDPTRRGKWCHPDGVVWTDFSQHHPRQVDKTNGWTLRGEFLIV